MALHNSARSQSKDGHLTYLDRQRGADVNVMTDRGYALRFGAGDRAQARPQGEGGKIRPLPNES